MRCYFRWHIRYPARVVSAGHVASSFRGQTVGVVESAFNRTKLDGLPSTWGDAEESQLLDGILAEVEILGNANFQNTMHYVRDWPNWGKNARGYRLPKTIGHLSSGRNSFQFDDTGLPPESNVVLRTVPKATKRHADVVSNLSSTARKMM